VIAYVEDRLPARPEAVPLARHALAVALLPEVDEEILDRTLLLATEAISTALRCTEDPWQLRVDVDPDRVRVTVEFRANHEAVATTEHSVIQDVLFSSLSDDWRVDVRDGRTSQIWFEVARAPSPV
jgi:hypothetical protein